MNEYIKCGGCKTLRNINDDFEIYKGKRRKTCKECKKRREKYRDRYKCEHEKRRSQCKDCGGSQICEHGIQRGVCKVCGGSQICEHGKQRSICKVCGGSSICKHGKQRCRCKDCDLHGYLAKISRNRIYKALKGDKDLSSEEYLGCDIKIFKKHIEDQFEENMSWDNHGKWHIDHITPVKYKKDGLIPTLEEVIKRLHYTNTQPLWASENRSKGNRFIG